MELRLRGVKGLLRKEGWEVVGLRFRSRRVSTKRLGAFEDWSWFLRGLQGSFSVFSAVVVTETEIPQGHENLFLHPQDIYPHM